MAATINDRLRERIVELLRGRLPGLRAVYLFGSAAAGAHRADSDVDIAVLTESPLSPMLKFDLAQALAQVVGSDVDLVDVGAASSVFRSQIVGNGERLYADDPETVGTFEDFVYADYARLNEERAGILADIRARGGIDDR